MQWTLNTALKSLAVATVLVAPLGLKAAAACDATDVVLIDIKDMAFQPAKLEICVGQTVRWTNNEPTAPRRIIHTVSFDPAVAKKPESVLLPEGVEGFKSGLIAPGQTFEHTFTVAGDYKYFCQPHELMGHLGALTVLPVE